MKCRQEIAGETASKLCDAVCRRRGNEKQIRRFCKEDMIKSAIKIATGGRGFEHIHVNLVSGKRSKSQGSHKLRGSFGHHDDNIVTTILEPAKYFRGLITGDPAADSKRDFHKLEV
jgi:hypothetical protein